MSALPPTPPPEPQPTLPATSPVPLGPLPDPARTVTVSRATLLLLVSLAGGSLLWSAMLWQKLGTIQEQLARQSADSGAAAVEARALARQAQDIARDASARQAVLESRLTEVAMQRSQIEELMQSLSRSRDENLVVDIESALRLAQQQTQLTGSAEPLLAALRSAEQRLARAGQPRLARLHAAVVRDMTRIRAAAVTDVPGVLARLDELVRQVDDLPLANAAPGASVNDLPRRPPSSAAALWWERWRDAVAAEARALVRVSRIEDPEAVLVAPEQGFFLRENLKLKLLNARLSLLARQNDAARADVIEAGAALHKYFDQGSRRTQAAMAQLQQVQAQVRSAELPRVDETLAALATAAAGK
ncbi:MAG: uroporphyrin-III C-methyltransferase (Urogen methylase)-like protein [Ramlibacter sp.]|uniref:uroporphyrinogen-III C-methyltransferase n=1 Tax=Ramlibacter sp. TaxID=1917967 RepID=UPI002617AAC4|nr:uroporphyrinogen-III C-methyltransferase [Ramlibacter sp.]MDB5750013.1 uroporphyrin-III C-methyltransferase (Urogen methylase)-like protein [Ramlibacter sp.]